MAPPLDIAYWNGAFAPIGSVHLSPLDRGFLFADAVYEVIPVYRGRPFLLDPHLQRLARSLAEVRIRNPHSREQWTTIVQGLVDRNGGGNLAVYLQVTRGADTSREHAFPPDTVQPTVFAMASPVSEQQADGGEIRAITLPDERWARCDIKSTALLPNVLARQAARDAGAGEAILLRDGYLTEGSGSSVVVVEDGQLIRHPPGHEVLPGTTADMVALLAAEVRVECRFEAISEARLRAAAEIWITAAMRGIAAVVELDRRPVGNGRPGPVWRRFQSAFEARKIGQ